MLERNLKPGLLKGKSPLDWHAKGNSIIERVILKEDTHWKELAIPNEIQVMNIGTLDTYDTSMCVSFNGTTDAIEYIMMQQMRLGLIPEWKVNWLKDPVVNGVHYPSYFEDGVLNFNERFIAILGETTAQGAYLYKVANAMRNYGLIPQKMFPFADNFEDNIDKKFIEQEMLDLGAEFARLFPINYEWVDAKDTKEFMKYSPHACFGCYGNMEGDEPIDPSCSGYHSMLQVEETDEYREIDDSYWQQFKKYKKHALDGFMAFYVDASDKNMFDRKEFIKLHDTYIIRNLQNGAFGVIYGGNFFLIPGERAGLFLIDRDMRGLLGKSKELSVSIGDEDFMTLYDGKNF